MSAAAPSVTVISGCAIATVDALGTEHTTGHLVVEGSRIVAVGAGPCRPDLAGAGGPMGRRHRACWRRPGLVNTHHHLYQWITRGYAQDETLFGWLTSLYPVWAGIDEETVEASAAANLGWMALSGCTLTTDHHYVFPHAGRGRARRHASPARRTIGLRFHPTRGSMDLGSSIRRAAAGLRRRGPPTSRWPRPRPRSRAGTTRHRTRCCRSPWHPAPRSR